MNQSFCFSSAIFYIKIAFDLLMDHDLSKKPLAIARGFFGAPWRTRTVDTKRRRLVLYPSELMVHIPFWDRPVIS